MQHLSQLILNPPRRRMDTGEAESVAETWWWIPPVHHLCPQPIILFSHVDALLDAMPRTLSRFFCRNRSVFMIIAFINDY